MPGKTLVKRESRQVRDPFALARSFFGFDPYFELRKDVPEFMPGFEVKETEDGYVVSADVPGVKEADLNINVNGKMLTVSGAREAEERKETETYYLYERQYGSFTRSFTLPEEADTESIDATMDGGVLTIKMGKKAESKTRKVAVHAK